MIDFNHCYRYLFERLDGRIRGTLRQEAIDRFSKPGMFAGSWCFFSVFKQVFHELFLYCLTAVFDAVWYRLENK